MIHITTAPTQPYHKSTWCYHLLRYTHNVKQLTHNLEKHWFMLSLRVFWVMWSRNIKLIPEKLQENRPRGWRNYPKTCNPCSQQQLTHVVFINGQRQDFDKFQHAASGVSFVTSLSIKVLLHRKPASTRTFCDTCHAQGNDKTNILCIML